MIYVIIIYNIISILSFGAILKAILTTMEQSNITNEWLFFFYTITKYNTSI